MYVDFYFRECYCRQLFLCNMNECGSIFLFRLQCYSWELTTSCLESRNRETWQQPQGVPLVPRPRRPRDQNQSKNEKKKWNPRSGNLMSVWHCVHLAWISPLNSWTNILDACKCKLWLSFCLFHGAIWCILYFIFIK